MDKAYIAQAARDDRDVFEQTSEMEFADRFGAAKDRGLMSEVSTTPKAPAEDAGSFMGNFADWWAKDSTQEKFHGILGALSGTFSGLAGLPLGGGDTSSLERGAVRASMAPAQAKELIRQRQFTRYIDNELANTTDPLRRDTLMAIKSNPAAASQYLAAESLAGRKHGYALEENEKIHEYKMAEIALRNEGRSGSGGLTGNRSDDIGTANNLFASLSPDEQKTYRETGRPPGRWFQNPDIMRLLPHLYSPNGGALANEVTTSGLPRIDLDEKPEGEDRTWREFLYNKLATDWDFLPESLRQWWMTFLEANEGPDDAEAVDAVRNRARPRGM